MSKTIQRLINIKQSIEDVLRDNFPQIKHDVERILND
jgi:hypothetical protein